MWRSVPSVNYVALTGPGAGVLWARGPNETGGYQLDARLATLQEQALAALTNHAQVQYPPPQQPLDDLSSFQRVLFTNHRVRALSDAVRQGTVPLPDPDRPLNPLEEQGKAVFERACGQCHSGSGQSTPQATPNVPPAPVVRFHNIASGCPRPVDTGKLIAQRDPDEAVLAQIAEIMGAVRWSGSHRHRSAETAGRPHSGSTVAAVGGSGTSPPRWRVGVENCPPP